MSPPAIRPMALSAVARNLPVRAAAIVALVIVAYNYSLMTLVRGLSLQTPLAYLALVPVLAFVLAVARTRLGPPDTPIHDRQLDWIIGLGFLAAAGGILLLAPRPESSAFWLARVDLLTLPLYVAGLVSLFLGVRRVWALRFPILFLLLAWPVPFTVLLSVTAVPFTEMTAKATALATTIVPIARPAFGDETLFLVGTGLETFAVSIGSACSGVNSFVGFLLLGAATLYLVRGAPIRRLAWLAFGLALTLGLNLARIMAILAVGSIVGEEAALGILHPMAGLVVFNVGVLVMLLLVPRFGLRFVGRDSRAEEGTGDAGPAHLKPNHRFHPALLVAVVIAVVLGATNAAYSRYEAISAGLADARLGSFDIQTAHVPGWKTSDLGSISQAHQYFGESATWDRVAYQPLESAALQASRTVYLDVVTTDDPGTFAAYGLEACYTFHGYEIASVSELDVGAGVAAQVIDYTNTRTDTDWSALWWEWPYTGDDGSTRYQRIVVFMSDGPASTFEGLADIEIATQDDRFAETDQFLGTLGAAIVSSQIEQARDAAAGGT